MAAATDETGRGTMRNHKTPAGETAGSERRDARGRLMSCAVAEFMEKGFAGASLRSIAAAADMTTGAIYGYFSGKEALFDAVVAPAADELYARYEGAQDRFYEQPLEAQTFERMRVYEERMMHDLLDFVYDNRDAFVLVFARSAGTAWERYLDRFIELEVRSTARYVREMREHGIGVVEPTPEMSRILAGMFFRGYLEPLLLGLSREAAHAFVADFERFFHAGYETIMSPQPS